jgi:hypothetical protein
LFPLKIQKYWASINSLATWVCMFSVGAPACLPGREGGVLEARTVKAGAKVIIVNRFVIEKVSVIEPVRVILKMKIIECYHVAKTGPPGGRVELSELEEARGKKSQPLSSSLTFSLLLNKPNGDSPDD